MTKPIIDENSDISNFDFSSIKFYYNNILTEAFIEKYQDEVEWMFISLFQELSEKFIEKNQDYVFWNWISEKQKISNKFIAKHIDKLYVIHLKYNKNIDQEFIEKLQLLK